MAEAATAAATTTGGQQAAGTTGTEAVKPGTETGTQEAGKTEESKSLISEAGKETEAAKSGEEGKKEEGKKEGEKPAPFAADKLQLPEGLNKADPLLTKFSEVMSSDMSPQERGQKLLDLYAEGAKKAGESATAAWNDLQTQWQKEVKADEHFGGDKLKPTLQSISKAIDLLDPAEAKAFRTALDVTGAGNNPAFYRGMARFAALLTEGKHVPGSPGQGKGDIAATFFPNSPEMTGAKT